MLSPPPTRTTPTELTTAQAMERYGVTKKLLENAIHAGSLRSEKRGRARLISVVSLEEYLSVPHRHDLRAYDDGKRVSIHRAVALFGLSISRWTKLARSGVVPAERRRTRQGFAWLIDKGASAEYAKGVKVVGPESAVVARFRVYLAINGFAEKTAKSYGYAVASYERWCSGEGVDLFAATAQEVSRWHVAQMEGAARASAMSRANGVLKFYEFVKAEGERTDNPASHIKVKAVRRRPRQPFSDEELGRLLEAVDTMADPTCYRALLMYFITTGVRFAEARGLTTDDIDWDKGLVRIRGKGSKERWVAAGAETLGLVQDYLGGRTGPVWLTQFGTPMSPSTLVTLMRRIGERADVHPANPHRYRVTFANRFMVRDGDLGALKVILGHSNIITTEYYAGYSASQRALKKQQALAEGLQLPGRALPEEPAPAATAPKPKQRRCPVPSSLQERVAERGWAVVK